MNVRELLEKYQAPLDDFDFDDSLKHHFKLELRYTVDDVKIFNEIYVALVRDGYAPCHVGTEHCRRSVADRLWNSYSYAIYFLGYQTLLQVFDFVDSWMTTIRIGNPEPPAITGGRAWSELCKLCDKMGIDLDRYATEMDEGWMLKQTITPIKVGLVDGRPLTTYENVHHIDFHAAWPSFCGKAYPELNQVWSEIWNKRTKYAKNSKRYKYWKGVGNAALGFAQSKRHKYGHAKLAVAAINGCNAALEVLTKVLTQAGYTILAYNTDGIWYYSPTNPLPYTAADHNDVDFLRFFGLTQGDAFGQFDNDHKHCRIKFYSIGVYQYVEEGECHTVMRGRNAYEKIKPREEWEFGELDNVPPNLAMVYKWRFDDVLGLVPLDWNDNDMILEEDL